MHLSAYSLLSGIEAWVTGYRIEHLQIGLQQAICQAVALLPVLINQIFRAIDRGGSALFVSVTVAVVLEPSTGDVFRKLFLRLAAAGVSGGISILVLYWAVGDNTYSFEQFHEGLSAWIVPCTAVCAFAYATNQQRFWHQREFWSVALLTMPIVLVPAVRASGETFYSGAGYRMLDVVIGILLAAVVSFVIFPVRARVLIEKKMASTLTRIGDQAVWLIGQACVPPMPGTGSAMPGRSNSDNECLYTDDGLRARLSPLMHNVNELSSDVSHMWKLLEAANAEVHLLRKPRRFPTEQYRNLLHSCHVCMGIFYTLINAMQARRACCVACLDACALPSAPLSGCLLPGGVRCPCLARCYLNLRSVQCGDVSLEVSQRHIGNLSEAGVRLSAGFTALGSLIRPPKAKKKGFVKQLYKRRKRKEAEAEEDGSPAAPSTPSRAAAAAEAAEAAQQGGADVEAASGALPRADSEDDPFAELEDEPAGQTRSPAPVVALSDSQLLSAQQMARHLSQVAARADSSSGAGSRSRSAHGGQGGASSAKLSPLAERGSAEAPLPAAEQAVESCDSRRASMGVGGLTAVPPGDGHRDWVLCKLRALVDAAQQTEAASIHEREAHVVAGLPSFMLLAHAVINLTRQCGACFTALDHERGAALHAYFLKSREAIRPATGVEI